MKKTEFNFLKKLVETPSPSGFEQPVQRIVSDWVKDQAASISTDVLGNLTACCGAKDGRRVMVTAHCDEIGLMVTSINDHGFLSFAPIGGIDAHLVPGQHVHVHTHGGVVPGVVGKKAIHLTPAAERDKVVPLKEQVIDCGFVSGDEAQNQVSLGDPVTFAVGLERLANDRVASRALDDKMGSWVMAETFRRFDPSSAKGLQLRAVSTVQEELGTRGAQVGTFANEPEVALVIEVGHATDTPGTDGKEIGEQKLGQGPVLVRGANCNPVLFEILREAAQQNDVPHQVIGTPGATGTDARVIQLSRCGVATALIRVPLRYMHSPVETLDLNDLENTVRLLLAALPKIAECRSFIPM